MNTLAVNGLGSTAANDLTHILSSVYNFLVGNIISCGQSLSVLYSYQVYFAVTMYCIYCIIIVCASACVVCVCVCVCARAHACPLVLCFC